MFLFYSPLSFRALFKLLEVKKVNVCNNRGYSLPQKTLFLKHLTSSPAFKSVTLGHHTVPSSHSVHLHDTQEK